MIRFSCRQFVMVVGQLLVLVLLTGCYEQETKLSGYLESQPIYVSSQGSGVIVSMPVSRGETVKKGQLLYAMDDAYQKDQVALSQARLDHAVADYQNLMQGANKEQIAAALAVQHRAQIDYDWAKRQYERLLTLKKDQFVSPSELDVSESTMLGREKILEQAKQEYLQISAPPRSEVVAMKQADITARKAELAQAKWVLSQQAVYASQDGSIGDVYIRESEEVVPHKPVLSLYDKHVKDVVWYLPLRLLPYNRVGDTVTVACEACADKSAQVTITYIADVAEFTPPLVYSSAINDKYVYFTKARFLNDKDADYFRYGQPVSVEVAGAH